MPTNDEQILVVPANGYGTRIRELTGKVPKTLLKVGGQPILSRLLSAASAIQNIRVVIYVQPEDEYIANFLNMTHYSCSIELRRMIPRGILPDLIRISKELGKEFSVFDSDLVAPLPELTLFLRKAPNWSQNVPLIIGATTGLGMSYERMMWLTMGEGADFTVTSPGCQGDLCFACAYHWRPMGLEEAETLLSSHPISFHDYMADLSHRCCHVGCVRFSAAHNVNTPDAFARAQTDVLKWQKQGIEQM